MGGWSCGRPAWPGRRRGRWARAEAEYRAYAEQAGTGEHEVNHLPSPGPLGDCAHLVGGGVARRIGMEVRARKDQEQQREQNRTRHAA
jgi:hypothetical protein